jgi:hypothetical protein
MVAALTVWTLVNAVAMRQDPRIGDRMEFDRITAGDGRIRAVNVQLFLSEDFR